MQTFPAIAAVASAADIGTLWCQPGGDCTGTGDCIADHGSEHAFAVSRTAGTWGAPALLQGFAAQHDAFGDILSCPSPGNCTLGSPAGDLPGAVLLT